MRKLSLVFAAIALWLAMPAESRAAGVERLYVLDCGQGHALDRSRWSINATSSAMPRAG